MPDFAAMLPRDRRELCLVLGGVALALGLSAVPGLTIEPEDLTQCHVDLAAAQATGEASSASIIDLESRIKRCWEMRRNIPPENP